MQCTMGSQLMQAQGSDHLAAEAKKLCKPGKAAGSTQPVFLREEGRLSAAAQGKYFGVTRKTECQWRRPIGQKKKKREGSWQAFALSGSSADQATSELAGFVSSKHQRIMLTQY